MSTPQPQLEHGMVVMTAEGLLGTVTSDVFVDQATSVGSDMLIVQDEDGRLRNVPRSAIDQITDGTIYLSVPRDSIPVMQPPGDTQGTGTITEGERLSVPLLEEQLTVGTHAVDIGSVGVRKRVEERIEQHTVGLHTEELEVERIEVNQLVDEVPESYMDGDVLVVPVVEEELVEVVVKRQLRVRQELRIRRVVRAVEHTIDVPLRSEQIEINGVKHDRSDTPS